MTATIRKRRNAKGVFTSFALAILALITPAYLTAEESYVLPSGEAIRPLDSFKECDICPEMVVMPLGKFMMGSTPEESAKLADFYRISRPQFPAYMVNETPLHSVEMTVPYAIGKFEVTREEWIACYNALKCDHKPEAQLPAHLGGDEFDHPRAPVFDVSYDDVQQYIRFLNWKVGQDAYRLPIEAEWEYAARGGTMTAFAQGETVARDQVNHTSFEIIEGRTQPVSGELGKPVIVDDLNASNPWGLWHIAGNLREMTGSCSNSQHAALATQTEYIQLNDSTSDCRRVLKDGGFNTSAEYARPAQRGRLSQSVRRIWLGFRVVRQLEK